MWQLGSRQPAGGHRYRYTPLSNYHQFWAVFYICNSQTQVTTTQLPLVKRHWQLLGLIQISNAATRNLRTAQVKFFELLSVMFRPEPRLLLTLAKGNWSLLRKIGHCLGKLKSLMLQHISFEQCRLGMLAENPNVAKENDAFILLPLKFKHKDVEPTGASWTHQHTLW